MPDGIRTPVSRTTLAQIIDTRLPDNLAGAITPADVRFVIDGLADSALWHDEASTGPRGPSAFEVAVGEGFRADGCDRRRRSHGSDWSRRSAGRDRAAGADRVGGTGGSAGHRRRSGSGRAAGYRRGAGARRCIRRWLAGRRWHGHHARSDRRGDAA